MYKNMTAEEWRKSSAPLPSCLKCLDEGAFYKFYSYGYKMIPCPEKACQERNLREAEKSKRELEIKLEDERIRFGIEKEELGLDAHLRRLARKQAI
ncbi:hypothetical protein [Jeotgalibacillus soli]|uniref:hypothetical protein n=1 Tax=Jeotgalibacillus soli TaxID=889306 RepID=UPI00059725B1|nr:hypothetical protein [Jeotgalibacillus soli]